MRGIEHPILALSPFETPDVRLCAAAGRAGATAVLDLGRDVAAGRAALAAMARELRGFGVRVPSAAVLAPGDLAPDGLPPEVSLVVVPSPAEVGAWRDCGVPVFAQVVSVEEALAAERAGASGLIAKGWESGGRVGDEGTFVLLQHLLPATSLRVWAQGGIGLCTAVAALAGGAAGVVLDTQLALVRESSAPAELQKALAAMDGSETALVAGHRVYARPDVPLARYANASPAEVDAALGARPLQEGLWPVGQDGALAKPLAERFRSVGGVVRALQDAMGRELRVARELAPLGPDSPLAQAHGLRYPIFQGPMTRVSDRASFAESVAAAGGLPFLALSLLRGEEVRALVMQTRALLGERPFGVGLLGFVPPELRDEQLAALDDCLPPVALIAGGRPSQARPLEARGTATYLHVPSPGLLDLFLAEGARRFVFEGAECGGHVGPRTSFALWEAQVQRLLSFSEPETLHVVFAGGIHDARSAAMVSALCAPLAARGVKVGVLLGTAYLFTEEAVASGAITAGFQDEALRCERTSLLETAPGHATRCVETPYVRAFAAEKTRLEAEGLDGKAVWAALEQLNLGRLRIAAKGVVRTPAGLDAVDEATQHREGMYMIGQVAALRREVTTIAALHEAVSVGASRWLDHVQAPALARPRGVLPADVAIIGMAGMFPGSPDTAAFWSSIVRGENAITEVPPERWNPELYFDPEGKPGEKTPSKWGGFLPDIPFDPAVYGIPPRSLSAIEPVQLLALEVARRALADAGYDQRELDRERTSVIFGAEAGTDLAGGYGFRALWPQYVGAVPPELDAVLPALTEDSFPGVLANVIAGRIANRLDLGGVNYTVDAACAASLAALDLAVKELTTGTSDTVLCGGADLHNSIQDYLMFASVHALSKTGQCRTFDSTADGISLGEGVAALVLKRLADAERDGDRIYAVLKGVGGSSDGRSLGLTAPHKDGQIRALERAYRQAGVSPLEIGLVEAHGTGTVVGDRTELATLSDVYIRSGVPVGSVTLGSVKSQIGHTKCAAGLAGLIKASLAIYHGILPPTLHVRTPNPYYDPKTSPFVFSDTPRPWLLPPAQRKAAVSAFGFGGTNFHAVLTGYEPAAGIAPFVEVAGKKLVGGNANSGLVAPPAPRPAYARWPAELFLVRGADRAAAQATLELLSARLAADADVSLAALARGVCARHAGEPVQVALVAASRAELALRLAAATTFQPAPGVFVSSGVSGPVAFLFPGQGSQRVGMLGDLFAAFPALQHWLHLGPAVARKVFPGSAFSPETRAAQQAALTDTRVAQPALGLCDSAMAELLGALGVRAEHAAGHSYGELVALAYAGALAPAELVALSRTRGEHILAAAAGDAGTMAAVSGSPAEVERALQGVEGVVLANRNAPGQTVISGPTKAVEAALVVLEKARIAARLLPVACAFHSPVVAGASRTLAHWLERVPFAAPRLPVWSNAEVTPYPADAAGIRRRIAEHVARPVRFDEEIEAMHDAGARLFVEVGPGRVLTGLVGKILAGRAHVAVSTDAAGEPGLVSLLHALATLAVHGVTVDVAPLFAGRAQACDLSVPPKPAPSTLWLVNGQRARPAVGEPPAGALRPVSGPVVRSLGALAPPAGDGREGVMLEYLRGVRGLVEQQREVMLRYLGAAPEAVVHEGRVEVLPAVVGSQTALVVASPIIDVGPPRSMGELLLDIVSARTGYPVEMLGLDLDLEAELSIDSIKRIEILGELAQRTGMVSEDTGARDELIEQLAGTKTLRAILAWLEKRALAAPRAPALLAAPSIEEKATSGDKADLAVMALSGESSAPVAPLPLRRYRFEVSAAPPAVPGEATLLACRTVLSLGRAPDDAVLALASAWVALLEAAGATVTLLRGDEPLPACDALLELSTLAADPAGLAPFCARARAAVTAGARTVVAVTGHGGDFGRGGVGSHRAGLEGPLGVAGFQKSLAKEWPDLRVRAIDLALSEPPAALAAHLLAELTAADTLVQVGYRGEARLRLSVVEETLAPSPLTLEPGAVVVVTGGARGITALAAVALAGAVPCRLELVGRTPLPADPRDDGEDDATRASPDRRALRQTLLQSRSEAGVAEIETTVARILALREIRATLAGLRAAGATARYHAVDVRDAAAFGALLDRLRAEHGRLDGVIHGAGVIEDKLLREKSPESFARVYETKVESARTLLGHLHHDVRFVAFFGSVSGSFGNRGQTDYAAANDALAALAHAHTPLRGRLVCLDWGPWGGTGMVSAELEREYQRRGIGLIAPDEGTRVFLAELAAASRGEAQAQVLLLCADAATF